MGVKYSAPFWTGHGVHLASCIVSFAGVKQSGHGIDDAPHLMLMLKKE